MNNYNDENFGYSDMMSMNNLMLPNVPLMFDEKTPAIPRPNNTEQAQLASLATPTQGYIQGNLFNNLYQGYKNYRPFPLTPRNEQEKMFLQYSELAFAAHELNLFLDNYPNNTNAIRLFNQYRDASNQALNAYEKKYGPITITSDTLNQTPWMWSTQAFPWDKGGM